MFLPGPYMLWWPALRASHPLRTPEAEEPVKRSRRLLVAPNRSVRVDSRSLHGTHVRCTYEFPTVRRVLQLGYCSE